MSALSQRTITLQLRAPVCLARRPTAPGQPVQTLQYISGTALRGGLAAAWLRGRRLTDQDLPDDERAQFAALFTTGALAFGSCLPQHLPKSRADEHARTMIVPLTAATQKRDGGWLYNEPEPGTGVIDLLKHRLCAAEEPEGLDRYDHLFAVTRPDGTQPQDLEVRRRQITRTAVDTVRGTARARQLYSFEALETGQRFQGTLIGRADLLDQLCMTAAIETQVISLGQGRSRGLGEVQIDQIGALEPAGRDRAHAIDEVRQFNQQVQALAAGQGSSAPDPKTIFLPVTLDADVLLRDNYLLPSSDPTPGVTLGRYLPLTPDLAREMRPSANGCALSTGWIGGWDEVRGLPRPPQLATSLGAVWTFAIPEHLLAAAVDWWLQAEVVGLGERRSEGYGRVRLCHPLHLTEGLQ